METGSLGGGEGQARKSREKSRIGPLSRMAILNERSAYAPDTWAAHEEMEDVLHEARASAAIRGGAEMEVMAMNLDEADSVKEGEHDVHQGPRVG